MSDGERLMMCIFNVVDLQSSGVDLDYSVVNPKDN